MKTMIENGIEYILKDDIWYPNLKCKEKGIVLGKYGMMRKRFSEEHRKIMFETTILYGK